MPPAIAPEGLRPPGGRPRDEDRRTRKPLPLWDRIKFLLPRSHYWERGLGGEGPKDDEKYSFMRCPSPRSGRQNRTFLVE